MNRISAIFPAIILSVTASAAVTDSVGAVNDRIAIHGDRLWRQTPRSFQNPAIRQWMLPISYSALSGGYVNERQSQAVETKLGDGIDFGYVAADSYIKHRSSTLWGAASYRNGRERSVVWNESSDAVLIYPYFTADSIGGDLKMEQYSFSGGYADHNNRWAWGAEIGYAAGLYYRDVDPRPRNVTGRLDIAAGGAMRIGATPYHAGISVNYRKYKQTCSIEFVNELSDNRIWHLTGLGTHYERFAGSGYSHYYNGNRFGATANLYPDTGRGAVFSASFSRFTFDHILTSLNKLPLQSVADNRFDVEAGWLAAGGRHDYAATVAFTYKERTGTENIFGDPSNSIYPQIGSMAMYTHTYFDVRAGLLWQWHPSEGSILAVTPKGTYTRSRTAYIDPHRYTLMSHIDAGLDVHGDRGFGKMWRAGFSASFCCRAPVISEIDFTIEPQTPVGMQTIETRSFDILSSCYYCLGAEIHASLAISGRFALMLSVAYSRGSYVDGIHSRDISTSISFVF